MDEEPKVPFRTTCVFMHVGNAQAWGNGARREAAGGAGGESADGGTVAADAPAKMGKGKGKASATGSDGGDARSSGRCSGSSSGGGGYSSSGGGSGSGGIFSA